MNKYLVSGGALTSRLSYEDRFLMERAFIEWLKTETQKHSHPNLILGIGDDAAIVDFKDGSTVISSDMLADGVHFVVGQTPLELIGRKALAVNLSDLAAMAARPVCAVVSLMVPKTMGIDEAKEMTIGMLQLADEYGVAIVGGDTNRWDGPLVVNVAITGIVDHVTPQSSTWRLDGAQAGDVILVSGDFGHSIKDKHLTFTPRVALALFLRDKYYVRAATDITDSLTFDVATIAKQSGLGMELDSATIPLSDDALAEYKNDQAAALKSALYDGEDFELAIAVDDETAKRIVEDQELPCKMTAIGRMTHGGEYLLVDPSGARESLEIKGYEHT